MSGPIPAAEGVTNPSIDDLLTKTDSKYKLVLYSAKRARQINAYYSQLGEGLLEYVGPLVDTHVQEKPLSIALREINERPADLRGRRPGRPGRRGGGPQPGRPRRRPSARRATRSPRATDRPAPMTARVVLGVSGGIAAYKACELLRRFTESGHDVTVVPTAAALRVRRRRHLGGAVGQAGRHRRLVRRRTRCRTCGSARRPTWSWSRPRPPTCWPGPRTAGPTTCSPRPCSPPAARWCSRRPCTPRCGSTRPPEANVATLRERGALVIEPAEGRLTGADTGQGRLPEPAEIFELAVDLLTRASTGSTGATPDLAGRHVVVSAGGTREYLDPVRFLGNRSSGLQGYALARAAAARGAEVTLVAANVRAARPGRGQGGAGRDHRRAARRGAGGGGRRRRGRDGRRPRRLPARRRRATTKIKKADDGSAPPIELTQNPDILAELSATPRRPGPGGRRLRRRDRRPAPGRCSTSPGPSWPARAATCSSSTTSAGARSSAARTTRR